MIIGDLMGKTITTISAYVNGGQKKKNNFNNDTMCENIMLFETRSHSCNCAHPLGVGSRELTHGFSHVLSYCYEIEGRFKDKSEVSEAKKNEVLDNKEVTNTPCLKRIRWTHPPSSNCYR